MRKITTILLLCLSATLLQAQIVIKGHVYGGGNAGDTGGNTNVTVHAGDLNRVFGGARMADVKGRAFMNIDGAHASNYIVINRLYGGNDIAGTIGKSREDLPDVIKTHAATNKVDTTWNALLLITTKTNQDETEAADAKKIYIGQLFGGGDGEYVYGSRIENDKTVYFAKENNDEVATSSSELSAPVLGKTFLDIRGGSIVYAYGGGNNATVTERTIISLDNPSQVVNSIKDATNPNADNTGELLTNDRFENQMGINTSFSYPSSDEYQIGRLFGGNNMADMAIRPRWNLQQGKIRNLYGGGNEGRMTCPEGLLLQVEGAGMVVDNVFGGCRKADVRPMKNGVDVAYSEVQLPPEDNPNNIPAGYAARVRVLAGTVNNVYGGNDISGNVYAGNTVGIRTNITGDVYGGGNGSYAYTDNAALKDDPRWKDFYYNPDEILTAAGITGVPDNLKSATALNLVRPNAEKVSILVRGDDAEHPVTVKGGLYVGGNSASLRENISGSSSGNQTHIKIGSHVIIDNVFLGNNGANMIKTDEADSEGRNEGVLRTLKKQLKDVDAVKYAGNTTKFNSMILTDPDVFAKYMEGCAMKVKSAVVFESRANGDAADYIPYSTQFGSFYCGGNVGSMITEGKTTVNFDDEVIIYDKVVGGCNNANVYASNYNAEYLGGLLGAFEAVPAGSPAGTIGDKLELNFGGLKIQPMRWKVQRDGNYDIVKDGEDKVIYELDEYGNNILEWNTISASTGKDVAPVTTGGPSTSTDDDLDCRLKGGNIYGGCYNTGHVNGNVVININASIVDRKGPDAIFDQVEQNEGEAILYGNDSYKITERRSGVILDEQGMDVLGKALNVFGGGYGAESEIWGSTTVNLNKGYVFQVFGGGENGAIGQGVRNSTTKKLDYTYDPRYSCHVNLKGTVAGVYRGHAEDSDDMAETEFIYGGSFEAPIAGNTIINLGNGRIFNSFAGSCNADILGHTETYIGRSGVDAQGKDVLGFPWIRDHVYGGNDLGGQILDNTTSFKNRVSADLQTKLHNPANAETPDVTNASAYMEYIQGRVGYIFGGCYGDYDYTDAHYSKYTYSDGKSKEGFTKPRLDNAFVNFRPNSHARNELERIFGAGQGSLKGFGVDSMQNRSYILIDIPQNITKFQNVAVFGAGANCGLGMGADSVTVSKNLDKYSAIIDLFRGTVSNVYGGSFKEGFTRRTMLNVPNTSTISVQSLFGGAYGDDPLYPCDVYESHVNYHSANAIVRGNIYGGNNHADRTLYAQVNINVPVYNGKTDPKTGSKYMSTVYGAGFGEDTWAQYTEVNLERGAQVSEVYGGGHNGKVINRKSLLKWQKEVPTLDLSMPGYHECGLDHQTLVHATRLGGKYHTNVHIKEGATVWNYAYGGGMGDSTKVKQGILGSGDVYGSTYIDLLGGTVAKDLYAAGTSGAVRDSLRVTAAGFDYNDKHIEGFTASSTAYIEGGKVRNVYGGGWRGSVGHHIGKIDAPYADDIPGETHVIIGKPNGTTLTDGIPAIERNAYGGGEGGAVFGTANITLNKGFIGYRFFDSEPTDKTYPYTKVVHDDWTGYYQEKIVDETWKDADGNFIPNTNLENSGNIFGGGYIDNSSVDITNVEVYGGVVRNSVFGGGEIAAIGRGDVYGENDESPLRTLKGIYKAGKTKVNIYGGWTKRNVFAGGKGIDNLGRTGSLYTNGYVFGKTEVDIMGGEIGTDEGVALGYGNVFGGGDIGYVYSAFEYPDGSLGIGKQAGKRYDDEDEGHYFKSKKNGAFTDDNGNPVGSGEKYMTEDSKVLVEPHCKVLSDVTINGNSYKAGDYVPTSDLNTLKDKTTDAATWGCLDVDGIIIHNAVFAGGNVSSGNDQVFANATTLFGNATASINDVYNRDLITIGTGHTGGLYGDGNLTFVDGYRELNITNYGTDYYHITDDITLAQYEALPARERAYYELKYRCLQECTDNEGTHYTVGSTIPQDELVVLFAGQTDIIGTNGTISADYWVANGVVSRYAGRIMNTIQRADFCGVFGSRMVMKGAQDRVPEIVDYTNYTINRVREVSLNKKLSPAGDTEAKHKMHGNYFGIYSNVNFLGALTSDVSYEDGVRVTDNVDKSKYQTAVKIGDETIPYGEATYLQWKQAHINDQTRNNGNSHNKVALASGVYLELTTEESTGNDLREKVWGYITGVIELDLINVQTGVGGGFVYAKNVHGDWSPSGKTRNTLTSLNAGAISNRSWIYTDPKTSESTQHAWQTSGNFVHSTQTIVDDCYDESAKYKGSDAVPAHYWFIKGSVYVYDQYISAYTGAPNAYSETVNIPLTISAASHGTMKLLNVKPNRYAYYSTYNTESKKKLTPEGKLVIKDVEYHLNDPISYWDWYLLPAAERNLFVDETYVTIADCKYSSESTDTIPAGTVMLPSEYEAAKAAHAKVYHVDKKEEVDFDYIFRSSNNLSHDTGYLLTYNVNNPAVWNKYYTPLTGSSRDGKITIAAYNEKNANEQAQYTDGPTYKPTANGLYGQREYKVTDIISKETYDTYKDAKDAHSEFIPATGQADFEPAFLVTSYVETTKKDGTEQRLQVGAKLAESDYDTAAWAAMASKRDTAYVCTSSITLSKTSLIYNGQLMTKAERAALLADTELSADIKADIAKYVVPAYYCSTAGRYGGDYYDNTKNYRALTAWSSMSDADRSNFTYNYDALDLLIDPTYGKAEGHKYQYDGYDSYSEGNKDKMIYSLEKPVDYTAVYHGSNDSDYGLVKDQEYTREAYEALPNEQRHYAPIGVSAAGDYYVVKDFFIVGETPYPVGTVISNNTYTSLDDETRAAKIQTVKFTADDAGKTFYYCREEWSNGDVSHPIGEVINEGVYGLLINKQKNFTIHGVIPMETSTLYVSRNSDIFDLSKEKIITVVYEYNYEESDESGLHITPVTERHVVNIHLQFKSGIPDVEDITKPGIVLPGTAVTLRTPTVTPGAYEVTGGGWELYEKVDDAESHTNGKDYYPGSDPLYWYQDGYYVAYYAQTYLGRTYSNHVPVTVANYHDLKKVMDDKENHLHVDYDLNRLKRESKIYINDYSSTSQNGLDLLKDFYDLSLLGESSPQVTDGVVTLGSLKDHALLDDHVKGGADLEFILHSNIDHTGAWTPIGETKCFGGNFHGDGYTISGLDHSLFDKLCGNVFNLGVTGSFTGAGVAETGSGYVENCWISSSSTEAKTSKPVFGNPTGLTSERPYRIVNCYYQEETDATNKYTNHEGTYGIPTRKNAQAFFNGEVAYDLNGFYLYKRYCDKEVSSGTAYKYLTMNEDGTPSEPHTAYYDSSRPDLCYAGYVESRYADGDFRYAGGEIPSTTDDRLYTETDAQNNTTVKFAPIWPDDYVFFGQKLTYGYDAEREHEELPAHIMRSASLLAKGEQSNRVYRAPAYFGSKTMDVAHFNPMAYLVTHTKPKTASDTNLKPAYPGMTAVDFAGHNDANWNRGTVDGKFYSPLLDDAGLTGINTNGQTSNMLVYAPAEASTDGYANKQTYDVLTDHFSHEPVYANYDETSYSDSHSEYKRVASAIDQWGTVIGHLVQSDLTAANDHLLVDKEDFNCPISYTFAGGKRMWYQRIPDRYVDITKGLETVITKGWETVSLPFTAELVTTQQKGEITHFYSGSRSIEGSDAKIGHEYWLREYIGEKAGTTVTNGIFTAAFNYPDAAGSDKQVDNTFLWDYYYSKNGVSNNAGPDANTDTYQTYYQTGRTLEQYPLLATAKPYIIGFPGKTYYEFDLSGEWTAKNTAATAPAQLAKQAISFVSNPGITIGISDDELNAVTAETNYSFMPNYMSKKVEGYLMNTDGNSFNVTPDGGLATVPFRPYFVAAPAQNVAPRRAAAESIVFDSSDSSFAIGDEPSDELAGELTFSTKPRKLITTSSLRQPADVRIYNVSGVAISTFTIQPGETIETDITVSGVYIIRAANGRYMKKLALK